MGHQDAALIKTIEIDPKCSPDGILADPFNQRIYVFSHPTADATVIDAKDGKVLGTIDLGGAPEQAVTTARAASMSSSRTRRTWRWSMRRR